MPDTFWEAATGGIHYSNGSVGINTDDLTNALFTIVGQDPDNFVHLLGDNGGEGNTISLSVSDMNASATNGSTTLDVAPGTYDIYSESPDGSMYTAFSMNMEPGGLFTQPESTIEFNLGVDDFSTTLRLSANPQIIFRANGNEWDMTDGVAHYGVSPGELSFYDNEGSISIKTQKGDVDLHDTSSYLTTISGGHLFLSGGALLFGMDSGRSIDEGALINYTYGIRSNNGVMEYKDKSNASHGDDPVGWKSFSSLVGIPLTGTEEGSLVTGLIHLDSSGDNLGFYIGDNENYGKNGVSIDRYPYFEFTVVEDGVNRALLDDEGLLVDVNITGSNAGNRQGIYSNYYYGPNYTDNTYVQKKYVDDAIGLLSSDERLKKNITDLSSVLDTLSQVRTVNFNWNTESNTDPQHIGFIAQDLKNYYPELVSLQSDGYYKVSYALMTPILTKAIQEINANITDISDLTRENTWRDSLIEWLGDITNGINRIFAHEVQTEKLCFDDVCMTKDDLRAMLESTHSTAGGSPAPTETEGDEEETPEEPSVPEEPQVLDEAPEAPPGDTDGAAPEPVPDEAPETPAEESPVL